MSGAGTLYVAVKGDTKDLIAALKAAKTESLSFGRTAKQAVDTVDVSQKKLTKTTEFSMSKFRDMIITVGIYTVAFQALNGAVSGVVNTFGRGLKTIEDFNLTVAASAAYITSFSKQANEGDLAGGFRAANEYAGALATKLESIDSLTIASGKDLQAMSESFIQHGVLLDINNQKQVTGFTNIATALALVTAGQNKDIQMRQEINALMMGQIRATDRLPKLLEAIDPKLKEHLEQWRIEGKLIENVGKLLEGFAASTGNLGDLWATVGSTMETIHNRILRGAMKPIFEDLIGLAKDWNAALQDAEGNLTPLAQKIQKDINDAYQTGKGLVKDYGGEIATLVGILAAAKVAQYAFNVAVKANPYIIAAGAVAVLNEQLKAFNMNIGSLPGKYTAMTTSIGNIVDVMRGLRDPETGKALTEQEQGLARIAQLNKELSEQKPWYQVVTPAGAASKAREEIRGIEQSLRDLSYAETDAQRERMKGGGEWSAKVVELVKKSGEAAEKQKALRDELDAFMENSDNISLAKALANLEKKYQAKLKDAGTEKALLEDLSKWRDVQEADIVAKDAAKQQRLVDAAQKKAAQIVRIETDERFQALQIQKKALKEADELDEEKWEELQKRLNAQVADTEQAYNKMTSLIKSSKKTEVETWQDAIDAELEEFERLSDGSKKYTDAIAEYRAIKNKELLDRIARDEKANLTAMGEMWLDFARGAQNNFSTFFSSVLKGEFDSIGEAFKSLCNSMVNSFINAVSDMAAQQLASTLFGSAATGTGKGTASTTGILTDLVSDIDWSWLTSDSSGGMDSTWGQDGDYTFADGGVLQGGSGQKDDLYMGKVGGKNVFAKGGEYFMPPEQTAKYYPILEGMRTGNDMYFASGGSTSKRVTTSTSSFQDVISFIQQLARAKQEALATAESIRVFNDSLNTNERETRTTTEQTVSLSNALDKESKAKEKSIDTTTFSGRAIDIADKKLGTMAISLGLTTTLGLNPAIAAVGLLGASLFGVDVSLSGLASGISSLGSAAMDAMGEIAEALGYAQSAASEIGDMSNAADRANAYSPSNSVSAPDPDKFDDDWESYTSSQPDVGQYNSGGPSAQNDWGGNESSLGNLDGYATGGIHSGGWRVVGEGGPELEFTPPSRIFSNSDSRSIMSGSSKEIAELTEVIISLGMTLSNHMRQSEKILASWDRIGLPTTRG